LSGGAKSTYSIRGNASPTLQHVTDSKERCAGLGIVLFPETLTDGRLCYDARQSAAQVLSSLSVIGRCVGADSTVFKTTTIKSFDRISIENVTKPSHAIG
jgi:hypothetical protein